MKTANLAKGVVGLLGVKELAELAVGSRCLCEEVSYEGLRSYPRYGLFWGPEIQISLSCSCSLY